MQLLFMKCTVCIDSETDECPVVFVGEADFVRCVLFVPAEQHPGYRNNTKSISGTMLCIGTILGKLGKNNSLIFSLDYYEKYGIM